MLKDHKKDNKEFQMEASNGQNPQEKEAAMQGDQIIKQHLQLAEQLAKAHNIAGGGKASM
jgi:putative membrane protein